MSAACVYTHLYMCARSTSSTLDTRSLDDYKARALSLSLSLVSCFDRRCRQSVGADQLDLARELLVRVLE
jgi:hypothetical protein